jgi:hypothetical protein
MTHIGLVNNNDGSGKSLEDILGLLTTADDTTPTSFVPTSLRGGVAISANELPSSPTPGTIAIDLNGNLKWWNGVAWVAAGPP